MGYSQGNLLKAVRDLYGEELKKVMRVVIFSRVRSAFIAIASISLLWAVTGHTAPACRHVLQLMSASKINIILEELAELRMKLDLEKAHGETSIASRNLEAHYRSKQKEVLENLNMDLLSLHQTLQQRIERLQAKNTNENKREQEEKKSQSEIITHELPIYSLEQEISGIDGRMVNAKILHYNKEKKSALMSVGGRLVSLDLSSNIWTVINSKSTNLAVTADRKELLSLTESGALTIYDLNSMQELHSVNLDMAQAPSLDSKHWIGSITVTQRADKVAFWFGETLFIFDTSSGSLFKKISEDKRGETPYFHQDNELLFYKDALLNKVNLLTGLKTVSDIPPAKFSHNGSSELVIGVTANSLISFSVDNLQIRENLPKFDFETKVAEIPGKPEWIAIFGTAETETSGIFDRKNLSAPIFDFRAAYLKNGKKIQDIFFSDDRDKIIVVYTTDQREQAVDIWTRN